MHAGPLPADCAGPNGRISLLPRGSCVVANNVVDGSRGNNLELLNPSPDLLDNTFIGAGSVGLLVHGHFAEPAFGPGNKINGSKLSGIELRDSARLRLGVPGVKRTAISASENNQGYGMYIHGDAATVPPLPVDANDHKWQLEFSNNCKGELLLE